MGGCWIGSIDVPFIHLGKLNDFMSIDSNDLRDALRPQDGLAALITLLGIAIAIFLPDSVVKLIGGCIAVLGGVALYMTLRGRVNDRVRIKQKRTTLPPPSFKTRVTTDPKTSARRIRFDDFQETFNVLRQRLRLRMLRAVLLRSVSRFDSLMTAAEQAQMRDAMRDYAVAKRRWLTASAVERLTLPCALEAAANHVDALVASYSLPSLPVALVGAGGLMSQLGAKDVRAVDGQGAPLRSDPVVGWLADGNDGLGGTDDDM